MSFLKPTKKKIAVFFGLLIFVVTFVFFFFRIERDIAGILLVPLLYVPYKIFDLVTFSYFAPQCGGVLLCFPTLPELTFVAIFDIVLLYIISCAIVAFKNKKKPSLG